MSTSDIGAVKDAVEISCVIPVPAQIQIKMLDPIQDQYECIESSLSESTPCSEKLTLVHDQNYQRIQLKAP